MSGGKTWVYWENRISGERKKLYPTLEDNGELLPWYLQEEERNNILASNKEDTDAACLNFCRTGEWPGISQEVKCSIYYRLCAAEDFVLRLVLIFRGRERVVVRPPNLKITPESEVWHFLLFDLWDNGKALFIPKHPNTQKVQEALGQILSVEQLLQEAIK